jgi:PadR family transcriptional regulator PadR
MGRGLGLAALRVLQAIADGREYGFDIIEATGLPSGTVYPALTRHERDGYLRSWWEDPQHAAKANRPARRYYRLTPAGQRALARTLAELAVPLRRVRATPARG